ncbi:hypothetical protein EYZ11_006685 [Aspergillus tanneri]|uniref:Uncharacterized protein n=1 Tax=Aspergillus tanneri TaxID=1220188 RepID=A0A4S3JET8_9EURO|nr:hypothetical protein EYZ11_006685 [Aspergillus tanneri]
MYSWLTAVVYGEDTEDPVVELFGMVVVHMEVTILCPTVFSEALSQYDTKSNRDE